MAKKAFEKVTIKGVLLLFSNSMMLYVFWKRILRKNEHFPSNQEDYSKISFFCSPQKSFSLNKKGLRTLQFSPEMGAKNLDYMLQIVLVCVSAAVSLSFVFG